eukprot:CAMPEP_0177207614 /NCGR_PEP_ID=MMETSP0367-20130122/30019_1 /TAXON_ID=447022 ORGANISM="Scrippsiella hangoei-like, Strain SHHI-4" /NCGR_SAMPLE_ID=MMETSP0367 /ASSEMBLY_ACC=CAM_ASM_000362 /LENGTH=77 /DNA_ID=CAMNT_0018656477 /DNA_START=195 /DNA_END=428 /DNA_ORIENTATION=-
MPAANALNGKRRLWHTERCNTSQEKAAMVNTCKRRLLRTASGHCATPTERCHARQDEAAMVTDDCVERQLDHTDGGL